MAEQTLREAIEELAGQYDNEDWTETTLGDCANDLRDILARFPKPSGPTVRARFALVTTSEGWAAYGHASLDDENAVDMCKDMNESDDGRVQFVEVDALLPEAPVTIEGVADVE